MSDNSLYYGDNLPILQKHIADDSIDLIYLDPPFNSNRSYNVLFRESSGRESDAQIEAFNDTWVWGPTTAQTLLELPERAGNHKVVKIISALVDGLGHNDVTAYLVMMTARLVELHRVLKATGSVYLHCDPTASHYLKATMDAIFGPTQFQGEIIWRRTAAHVTARRWARLHDVILCFAKDLNQATFNPPKTAPDEAWVEREYRHADERGRYMIDNLTGAGTSEGPSGRPWHEIDPKKIGAGRHWRYVPETLDRLDRDGRIYWPTKGRYPKLKQYLDETGGKAIGDLWTDIQVLGRTAGERLHYPTQKPLALLERIIEASSNPGDVVLDPFCGCGTAVHAAQKLGRPWVGIDITHLAIALIKYRMEDAFPGIKYQVHGEPRDVAAAHQLAHDDRFQFQWWALSRVKARPYQDKKKGADTGIDGLIYFNDDPKNATTKTIVVQVKSGKVDVRAVRELANVVARDKAEMGLLITLEDQTGPMAAGAIGEGFYVAPTGNKYPKIQIMTVGQLLEGDQPKYPYGTATTFKQAEKEPEGKNLTLF